jgi:hypothetical protein
MTLPILTARFSARECRSTRHGSAQIIRCKEVHASHGHKRAPLPRKRLPRASISAPGYSPSHCKWQVSTVSIGRFSITRRRLLVSRKLGIAIAHAVVMVFSRLSHPRAEFRVVAPRVMKCLSCLYCGFVTGPHPAWGDDSLTQDRWQARLTCDRALIAKIKMPTHSLKGGKGVLPRSRTPSAPARGRGLLMQRQRNAE